MPSAFSIDAIQPRLHVLERDVGVEVGRHGGRRVAQLLLHHAQVARLLEQVQGQSVPGAVDR